MGDPRDWFVSLCRRELTNRRQQGSSSSRQSCEPCSYCRRQQFWTSERCSLVLYLRGTVIPRGGCRRIRYVENRCTRQLSVQRCQHSPHRGEADSSASRVCYTARCSWSHRSPGSCPADLEDRDNSYGSSGAGDLGRARCHGNRVPQQWFQIWKQE